MWKVFRRKDVVRVELPAAPASKGETNRQFFEELWQRGDHWQLETDTFERGKYAKQMEMIGGRRYRRALEIGCGAGVFTRMLGGVCERVVAIDVSPGAIARAKRGGDGGGVIEFRTCNVMEMDWEREEPFDLIVMAETVYYLGWLYTFFEVSWMCGALLDASGEGGRLIMTNTGGVGTSYLHRPWVLKGYCDVMRNVGWRVEREEMYCGEKEGMKLEASVVLFEKPVGAAKVCE